MAAAGGGVGGSMSIIPVRSHSLEILGTPPIDEKTKVSMRPHFEVSRLLLIAVVHE
jgi:hypothetical protein